MIPVDPGPSAASPRQPLAIPTTASASRKAASTEMDSRGKRVRNLMSATSAPTTIFSGEGNGTPACKPTIYQIKREPNRRRYACDEVPAMSARLVKRPAQQIPRHDQALHFTRAFADAADADLAVPAFERQVLGHPVAAVDLHRAVDNAAAGLARDQLRHRRLRAERLVAFRFVRRRERYPARRADVYLVVDDHPLDRLARRELVAERHALVGVGDRHLLRFHGHADAAGGVRDALTAEPVVRNGEALMRLAKDVPRWHAQVLELQLRRVMRRAQGMHNPADVEALHARVDDEARNSVPALRGVRARKNDPVVGRVAAADEDLRTVDHPVVA